MRNLKERLKMPNKNIVFCADVTWNYLYFDYKFKCMSSGKGERVILGSCFFFMLFEYNETMSVKDLDFDFGFEVPGVGSSFL